MKSIRSDVNRFGGRVIDPASLCAQAEGFRAQLAEALERWRADGTNVAWLEIETQQSRLIPVAVEHGFVFHNVTETGVKMTASLVPGSQIPQSATHHIGAGGVVVKDDEDLLVVSERYRRNPAERHLKLPGGALVPGEHIADAVMREILEETGVRTRFRSLVCFRHWHGYRDGKSDIYFVCRLDPLTTELCRQEEEIDECFWIPIEQYLSAPDVHAFNKRIVRAALEGTGMTPQPIRDYGTPETHELFMPADLS